jgi:hypothetical protein
MVGLPAALVAGVVGLFVDKRKAPAVVATVAAGLLTALLYGTVLGLLFC